MPLSYRTPDGDTLADIDAELAARGYRHVDVLRRQKIINEVVEWICDQDHWPLCEVTNTVDAAPVTIPGLIYVQTVEVTALAQQPLQRITRTELEHDGRDLALTGGATYFYVTESDTINTYPVDTAPLTIKALAYPARMVNQNDPCGLPKSWTALIVDAAARALEKDAFRWDGVRELKTLIETDLAVKRERWLELPEHIGHGSGEEFA